MFTRRLDETLRNARGGQVSYLLMGSGDFGSEHLAVTWVIGETGSEQPMHEHPKSEQVYVIVAGRGLMSVGEEREEVDPGTLVLVPPGMPHSIRSIGQQPLAYVSATSPPFDAPPPDSPFAYRPPRL